MLNRMSDSRQPDSAQPPVPPYAHIPQQGQGGYPGQAGPPAGQTAVNTPGRLGFILGVVGLGVGLLTTAIVQVIIRSPGSLGMDFGYAIIGVVNGAGAFIALAASLAALILGIIGLRKAGAPHAQAGIATGLGISGVVGGIFTFLLTVAAPLFY